MSDTHDPSLDIILDSIDSDYRQLIKDIEQNTSLSTYQELLKSERENLSLEDQLVLIHSRPIVLPKKSIERILQLLHVSHAGITKTSTLAKNLYF